MDAFLIVATCSLAFVLAGHGSTATGGIAQEELKQATASNCPKVDTATRQIIDEKGKKLQNLVYDIYHNSQLCLSGVCMSIQAEQESFMASTL